MAYISERISRGVLFSGAYLEKLSARIGDITFHNIIKQFSEDNREFVTSALPLQGRRYSNQTAEIILARTQQR
jgi:hypothetical protein